MNRAMILGACIAGLTACQSLEPETLASVEPQLAPELEPAAAGATLFLTATDAPGGLTVDVHFRRREQLEGPRAAEIWLKTNGSLRFSGSSPGAAANAAGKTVVAQAKPDGEVRLVLFATGNLDRLDSGVLARLTFERTAPGPADVELLAKMPVFAPPETNEGVILGEGATR